jgi:hypothetical protein
MDAKKPMRILRATNNGICLEKKDLSLLNSSLGRDLSSIESTNFNNLYSQVVNGDYPIKWLHGVKFLTCDSYGLIYWRGVQVDYIQSPTNSTSHIFVKRIADKCRHLESLGVQPDSSYTILRWCWMEGLALGSAWLPFFALKPSIWVGKSFLVISLDLAGKVIVIKDGRVHSSSGLIEFLKVFFPESIDLHSSGFSVVMQKLGFNLPDIGQREDQGLLYSPAKDVIDYLVSLKISPVIFGEIWENIVVNNSD